MLFSRLLPKTFAALALLAGSAIAQESAPDGKIPFGETLDVHVVNIEVRVTDRQGIPVRGLQVEDFTLREDRRKVEIVNFAEIPPLDISRREMVEAAPSEAAFPDEPRRIVFVFDDTRMHPRDRRRVLEELVNFVRTALDPETFAALAVYDGRMRVVEQPTRDRDRLLAAVDQLPEADSRSALQKLDSEATLQRLIAEAGRIRGEVRDGVEEPEEAQRKLLALEREVGIEADRIRNRNRHRYEGLGVLIDGLAELPGRKALVYISDGLDLRPGQAAREVIQRALDDIYARAGGGGTSGGSIDARSAALGAIADQGSRPPRRRKQRAESPDELPAVAALAAASRVSFYPWTGQGNGGIVGASVGGEAALGLTPDIRRIEEASRTDSLKVLAEETGGRVAVGTSFQDLVEKAVEDFGGYYSLGFSPDHGGDNRLHRLKVKVKGSRLEVRYPKSYLARPPSRPES